MARCKRSSFLRAGENDGSLDPTAYPHWGSHRDVACMYIAQYPGAILTNYGPSVLLANGLPFRDPRVKPVMLRLPQENGATFGLAGVYHLFQQAPQQLPDTQIGTDGAIDLDKCSDLACSQAMRFDAGARRMRERPQQTQPFFPRRVRRGELDTQYAQCFIAVLERQHRAREVTLRCKIF